MQSIREFLLDKKNFGEQTLYLPSGAEVISVIEAAKGLMLLALVPFSEQEQSLRTFKICNTDESIYNDNIKYIGSFESGIKHVIEINKDYV